LQALLADMTISTCGNQPARQERSERMFPQTYCNPEFMSHTPAKQQDRWGDPTMPPWLTMTGKRPSSAPLTIIKFKKSIGFIKNYCYYVFLAVSKNVG